MNARRAATSDLEIELIRLGPWATQFDVDGRATGGSYRVADDDPLIRAFLELAPCPQRVLELGCMEGGRTFPLARRVGHVTAVDARREHLERARFIQQRLGCANISFLEMDLECCDVETIGRFDAIYNVGLLYHLSDPARLLRQAAAVSDQMFLWTQVVQRSDVEKAGYQGQFVHENPADVIGGVRSKSFRPTLPALLQMLSDTGYCDTDVLREDENAVTLWCRSSSQPALRCRVPRSELSVAVVITCHNYGRFLDDCLRSVTGQTRRPDDILVVDDASEDETRNIVARWEEWGVRYLRVEQRNAWLARKAGLQATQSDVLCFVDADDLLSPDYLRCGISGFDRHDVGIVYSDMDRFGSENVTSVMPEDVTLEQQSLRNVIHCAALVRREAIDLAQGFDIPVDPRSEHEDWLLWLRIMGQGWRAKKQRAIYYYRRHAEGKSLTKKWDDASYYDRRGLRHETITLFIPLSGRAALWPRLLEFLQEQTWPHDRMRLFLLDTSQNVAFSQTVRQWLAECDYPNVRYEQDAVGEPGLADIDRRGRSDVQDAVRLAAARIYNRLAREVAGNFVWILEDDIIPPLDTAELLLAGFDQHTASVAGPYRSPYHHGYVAWTAGRQMIRKRAEDVQQVEGNGFGCVMLRTGVLREAVFTCRQPPHYDFDPAFYEWLKATGLRARLCWDAECQHLTEDR